VDCITFIGVRHDGPDFCVLQVYVLHAFQKKSKKGIATPKHEIEKVQARLRRAQEIHTAWQRTMR
jgi:hypothetical protein